MIIYQVLNKRVAIQMLSHSLNCLIAMLLIMCYLLSVKCLDSYAGCLATIDYAALRSIESSNNPKADSFLGAKYGRGLYQVSEIALADYLQYHKQESIQPSDLYNPSVNTKICEWLINNRIPQLLKHYGEEVNTEAILHSYNLGTKAYCNGKRNLKYIRRYYEALEHTS